MIITYEDFIFILNSKIKSDDEFFYELLCTVVSNPNRYTGIFRLSSAKTKLIQNVTQSREIKFGDFMEDIITKYIEKIGYKNYTRHLFDALNSNWDMALGSYAQYVARYCIDSLTAQKH